MPTQTTSAVTDAATRGTILASTAISFISNESFETTAEQDLRQVDIKLYR